MSWQRYLAVLGGFASQRLIEMAYSRRNERRLHASDPEAPRASPAVFRWIAAVNLALFTLPALERAIRGRQRIPPAVAALGWSAAIAALALRVWAIASLREAWNIRAVVPNDLRVVSGGPYRFVRHPNYLALMLEFAGLPLVGGAYVCAAVLSGFNGVLLWARIRDEETLLNRHAEYRRLMADKPRFIPRFAQRPDKSASHSRGLSRVKPQ